MTALHWAEAALALGLLAWAAPAAASGEGAEANNDKAADESAGDDDDSGADEASGDESTADQAPEEPDPAAVPSPDRSITEHETVQDRKVPWSTPGRSDFKRVQEVQPSLFAQTQRDLEEVPGNFGDPMRALQALPAVSGDTGTNAWFLVRGGTPSEVVVEVDGLPIRRNVHLTGLYSIVPGPLLKGLSLEAAGPSPHRSQGLSGGLFLELIEGPAEGHRFDGHLALDFLAGSAHVAAALDKKGRHTVLVGTRQSWLGLYLQAAAEAGALEGEAAKTHYGTTLARYVGRPDDFNRVRATLLVAHDDLLFDDVHRLHRAWGFSFDWRWNYGPRGWLEAQVVHGVNEEEEPDDDSLDSLLRHPYRDREQQTRIRTQLLHQLGDRKSLRAGAEVRVTTWDRRGDFQDTRGLPPWIALPTADLEAGWLALDGATTRPAITLFAEGDFKDLLGPLRLAVGLRSTLWTGGEGRVPYISPRLALSLPLDFGLTLAGSFALVHQPRLDPLVLSKEWGRPDLLPERALHATIAAEQFFAWGLKIRVEFWHKAYDQLVVWGIDPSSPNGAVGFTNEGFGQATGLEAQVQLERGRLRAHLAYQVMGSERSNPLDDSEGEAIPALGDQLHGASAGLALVLGKRRQLLVSADYHLRTGWPMSTMRRVETQDEGIWRWAVDGRSDRRMPDLHRVSVQMEGTHPIGGARLRGTVAVAAQPGGTGFVEDCPSVADEDGNPPSCRSLNFLPVVMPWLGLRLDW